MLKPAILYQDQLERKFQENLYTEDYYYYAGYEGCSSVPDITAEDHRYHWVSVDSSDNILGYFTYYIYRVPDTVCSFGLYAFKKHSPTFARDIYRKLENLIENHHRLEWRMISTNPIGDAYNRFLKQYGNYNRLQTTRLVLHDVNVDPDGKYSDDIIYEIINPNVMNR